MSAPLTPAACTATTTSPLPGTGSGRSSTRSLPSATMTARMRRHAIAVDRKARFPPIRGVGSRQGSGLAGVLLRGDSGLMKVMSLLSQPPIWREGLVGLEVASLIRHPIFRGEGVPDAKGQPVLLIPGFLAGDDSLGLMTRWLRKTGHHTRKAGMRSNIDCSEATVTRLEERVEVLAECRDQKVAIIGQSRGGNFARVLAVRRPDLVSGIVALGSPQLDPLAVHPLVRVPVLAVGALGTLGAPGLFSPSCRNGHC